MVTAARRSPRTSWVCWLSRSEKKYKRNFSSAAKYSAAPWGSPSGPDVARVRVFRSSTSEKGRSATHTPPLLIQIILNSQPCQHPTNQVVNNLAKGSGGGGESGNRRENHCTSFNSQVHQAEVTTVQRSLTDDKEQGTAFLQVHVRCPGN